MSIELRKTLSRGYAPVAGLGVEDGRAFVAVHKVGVHDDRAVGRLENKGRRRVVRAMDSAVRRLDKKQVTSDGLRNHQLRTMDSSKLREAYVSFDRAVGSFQAEKLEVRGFADVVDVMHEQRQGSAEVRNLERGIRSGSWQANVDVEFNGAPGTRRRDPMGRLCNTQVVNTHVNDEGRD